MTILRGGVMTILRGGRCNAPCRIDTRKNAPFQNSICLLIPYHVDRNVLTFDQCRQKARD